jgi:hypothetical protein
MYVALNSCCKYSYPMLNEKIFVDNVGVEPKHFACKANDLPLASRPKVVKHGIEPCSPVYRTDVITILLHYKIVQEKGVEPLCNHYRFNCV